MWILLRPRFDSLAVALFAGLLLHVFTPTPATGASALRFTAGFRWFDSGRVAEDIHPVDLDGDGALDLVLVQPSDDAVSVLLGAPGGGFRSRIGFAAGPDPRMVAALDADRDGRLDLAVTNRAAGTVSILRGRGDGTVDSPRSIATVASPGKLLARELDGDGILDLLLVTGADQGTLVFIRGRGDGNFDAPVVIRDGAGPLRMNSIELPGARHQGVAVAAPDGMLTVFASTPSGRFRTVDELRLAGWPSAMCTADLDGDGFADVVVALAPGPVVEDQEQSAVQVVRGSASGHFLPSAGPGADFVPACITAVDVDGDGWNDLVAADRRGGGLGVFHNEGKGKFHFAGEQPSRLGSRRLAIGDWNCDGRVDLAAIEPAGRGAVVLAGQGDGRFGDAVDVDTDFGPAGLWLGDVHGDGLADLVATDVFTGRLAVLRGDGAGAFAPQGDATTYVTASSPGQVLGAQLRPGGPVDLVIAHGRYEGMLTCGRNQGDGTFTFAPEDTVLTGGRPVAFILGDVDLDGALDAVVANSGTNAVGILRGDGQGWLHSGRTLALGDRRPVALALGDLDGDGRPDLVVASEHVYSIRVFRGAGGGEFTPGQEILPGLRPRSIALADLDADGDLDIVTGQGPDTPAGGLIVVYRGDGHGAFGAYDQAWTTRVGADPARLLVLDVDHDGVNELITANAGASTVTLVPGPGSRGFAFGTSVTLGTRAAAGELVAGDIDRDGWTDLAFAGRSADRIGLLRNRTGEPAPFRPGVTLDVRPGTCPNPVGADGGTLRVALVSGGGFDFADLLPQSVRLEGVPALATEPEMADESGPVDACTIGCGCEGRVADGVDDAIFTFDAAAVFATLGPVRAGESRELRLTANLRGGGRIEVMDCIVAATAQARGAEIAPVASGIRGPNPLSPGGRITYAYEVPAGGAEVRIAVFDVAGRRVASLVRGFAEAGAASVSWAPADDAGRALAPGVYFLRAQVGATRSAARLVLVP